MKKIKVLISSVDKVKRFVEIANKFDFDIDLVSGRYIIDAKSIVGIFTLNLTKEIDCVIHADENCAKLFIDTIDTMVVVPTQA